MVRTLFSPRSLYAGVSKRVLLYSRCTCSHASFSTCFKASSLSDFTGSQLLETRHAITSCLEATRRCDAAPVVSSRSLGWVIPKPGRVGFESCRLVHGMCDFWKAWHRGIFRKGTWPSYCYGFQRARRREGRQWLHTWHWQHAVDTRASHLSMKVWTWQTPSVRWTEKKHGRRDSTKTARD